MSRTDSAEQAGAYILVVDDNDAIRYATSRLLKNAGFRTSEVKTGAQCMAEVEARPPDLLVLDVNLPDMHGMEVCRRLKSKHETENLPIVHLSASSLSSADRVQGLNTGADAYITEPCDPAVLVSTINALLRTRRAEARVRQILTTIADCYLLLDAKWHITEINPAFEAVIGRTRAQAKGTDFWSQLPSLANSVFETEFKKALANREAVHFEGYIPQKESWYEVHAYPRDETLEVYMRDITQRKQIEQERVALIEREKQARLLAESANRAKDQFLAMLSHELRTPLNAITGWTQVLRKGKLTPAETEKALDVMYRNAQAQRQLIDDLIDISRIISNKLNVDLAPTELVQIVGTSVDSFRPIAAAKKIKLSVTVDLPIGLIIMADVPRLQQIFGNVLSNALKFTGEGGEIVVALSGTTTRAIVTIKDSGIGIDPQFLPRIFERFQQQDMSTTRRHSGLGLGLAITSSLIELHNGTIRIQSDGEGKGATVTLEFPALARANPDTHLAHGRDLSSPHRIFLVDDDTAGTEVLAILLRTRGLEVTTFNSAKIALQQLPELPPPAVIVSDIAMPEVDGNDFIRQLRLIPGYEKVPGIAFSAYSSTEFLKSCLAAGFKLYVTKPATAEEMISAIETVLAQS